MDKLTQMQQHIEGLRSELIIRDSQIHTVKVERARTLRITHAIWISAWLFTITIAIDLNKSVRADNYDLEQSNAELMNAFNRSANSCALEIEMKQQAIKDCIATSAKL